MLHRLPQTVRAAAYAAATGVLLYLTQAPGDELPSPSIWDKTEHALAWFVLAGVGLAFWPRRPGRVAAFALAFGALVEVLQASLPFGRDGDMRDLVADSLGVLTALLLWRLAVRPRRRGPA